LLRRNESDQPRPKKYFFAKAFFFKERFVAKAVYENKDKLFPLRGKTLLRTLPLSVCGANESDHPRPKKYFFATAFFFKERFVAKAVQKNKDKLFSTPWKNLY